MTCKVSLVKIVHCVVLLELLLRFSSNTLDTHCWDKFATDGLLPLSTFAYLPLVFLIFFISIAHITTTHTDVTLTFLQMVLT